MKSSSGGRDLFKVNAITAGCLVALMAGGVQAQEAQKLDTVVVTGIRKGIEEAISVKKNKDTIVEAISAEDIGKLPDQSVAESIARLPGVAAQRNKVTGKASTISIRGMSPDLNGSLFNGREQASTGDSRSPEFDVYPAELVSGILVHKTPDATLVGQGLSSTVNIQTVQPLNFPKRVVAGSYRRSKAGVDSGAGVEGSGDKFSLSYIDQFADRTIGVALAFSRLDERDFTQLKHDSWGGWAADVPFNGATVKVPGGFKADVETNDNTRDGFLGVFQFKPSKNFKSTLDVFHSKGTNKFKRTGLEGAIPFGASGAGSLSDQYDPPGVLSNATISNGVATAGTMSNYKGVVRNHLTTDKDKLTNIGWNSEFKVSDDWTLIADLSLSKAERNTQRYETTIGQAGNVPAAQLSSISWTGFDGKNFADVKYRTSLDFSNPSLVGITDVEGWSGGPSSPQAGYLAMPHTTDDIKNLRLASSHDVELGPISNLLFGLNLADREKVRTSDEFRLAVRGGNPYGVAKVENGSTVIASVSGVPVLSFDPTGTDQTILERVSKVDEPIRTKFWDVQEKVTTAFVKGSIDEDLGGMNLRGNVGVQWVRTDQSGGGYVVDRAKCTGNTAATCPATYVYGGKKYDDVLPSLNLALDLGDDYVARLGVAKVLARPVMNDMRAGLSVGITNASANSVSMFNANGGNPELEPFRAKAFDLSLEKYFGKKGVISLAYFYKDLDTYVLNIARPHDFSGQILAGAALPDRPECKTTPVQAACYAGVLTSPFNGSGGSIKGVEVNFDLPFSLAADWLNGFGLQFNHSDTKSSVTLPVISVAGLDLGGFPIPLPGLSRKVTNAKIYYEAHGFQIGVAQKKRSDFIGEIRNYEDTRLLTFINGETILDFQMAYEFQSGPAKGLSLNFAAQNLGNEDFKRYIPAADGTKNFVETIKYGKSYQIGLNYRF